MRHIALSLSAAAILGSALLATPAAASPATHLPALSPLLAGHTGSAEPARYAHWRCIKKGRCWVPCQGQRCRRVCFKSWWSCRKSLW